MFCLITQYSLSSSFTLSAVWSVVFPCSLIILIHSNPLQTAITVLSFPNLATSTLKKVVSLNSILAVNKSRISSYLKSFPVVSS
nr:MAG TPA: hypothetical protein [Caudoviricetes sp.]